MKEWLVMITLHKIIHLRQVSKCFCINALQSDLPPFSFSAEAKISVDLLGMLTSTSQPKIYWMHATEIWKNWEWKFSSRVVSPWSLMLEERWSSYLVISSTVIHPLLVVLCTVFLICLKCYCQVHQSMLLLCCFVVVVSPSFFVAVSACSFVYIFLSYFFVYCWQNL